MREKTRYNSFLATNLEENVVYFFSVKAETSVGSGEEVIANVTTGTNPGKSFSKPHFTFFSLLFFLFYFYLWFSPVKSF